jgi:acetyl-CoA acyltransferase
MADVIMAGGVESMSLIPMGGNMMMVDPSWASEKPWAYEGMGMTAENVANDFNISREEQDEFGVRSNELAAQGHCRGQVQGRDRAAWTVDQAAPSAKKGKFELYDRDLRHVDEGPRPGTTMETLAKLRPAFMQGRNCHRGQLLPDERRRFGGDVHVQGKGRGAWASSPC